MRRTLVLIIVFTVLGGCAASSLAATPSATSCRGANAPGTFPAVQRLQATGVTCVQATGVATDIQRYWKTHSANFPADALAPRAGGYTCQYQLRHNPAGDPYYHARCRQGDAAVAMDLTS